jgi:hypothetical protein
MDYFLGEIVNPNGTKDFRLIKANDVIAADKKLKFIVGNWAKSSRILMTL